MSEPKPLNQNPLLRMPADDFTNGLPASPATPPRHLPGSGRAKPRPNSHAHLVPVPPPVIHGTPHEDALDDQFAAYRDINWERVEELRAQASSAMADRINPQGLLETSPEAREEGRRIVSNLVDLDIAARLREGKISPFAPTPLSDEPGAVRERRLLIEATLSALFDLGRLQPLLDVDAVENIDFIGWDFCLIGLTTGEQVRGPQDIFKSHQDWQRYVQHLANRDAGRPFSRVSPNLDLKLRTGERLSATDWVSAEPYLSIRKHRLTDVTLDDLVARGLCSDLAAGYLRALVKSGLSVVVAGEQGAGKTTTLRALCREIPPNLKIGTFETEFELGLHEIPGYDLVKAFEARPGSGEASATGGRAGEITIAELLINSFRMNLDRQIVGEVRGPEVLTMIKAMQSGAGSLSTTHSRDAQGAVDKLITCALEAGPQITMDYATRAISAAIDCVVYVKKVDMVDEHGKPVRRRFLSEIVEVNPSQDSFRGYSVTPVFATTSDSPFTAVPLHDSQRLKRLTEDAPGVFDVATFSALKWGE